MTINVRQEGSHGFVCSGGIRLLYGVSRGDGEKTTIVRGLSRGNRGPFTQRSRWSIEYNTSQVRLSALTGVSIHHTSTPSARTSWIKDIKAV